MQWCIHKITFKLIWKLILIFQIFQIFPLYICKFKCVAAIFFFILSNLAIVSIKECFCGRSMDLNMLFPCSILSVKLIWKAMEWKQISLNINSLCTCVLLPLFETTLWFEVIWVFFYRVQLSVCMRVWLCVACEAGSALVPWMCSFYCTFTKLV